MTAGILIRQVLMTGLLVAFGIVSPRQADAQTPQTMDKSLRTAPEQKIDSQLIIEIERSQSKRGTNAPNVPATNVRVDSRGRANVDIRARVTPAVLAAIRSVGGTIVSTWPQLSSVLAWVPLSKLKALAANPAVVSIIPAAEATTNTSSDAIAGGGVK